MAADRRALAQMFADVTLGSPDNAIGFVLWRLVHRFQRKIDRALAEANLTHLQFTTLALVAWLSREEGVAQQVDISRQGDIHPMQVSLMLKTLAAKGLVIRTPSEARPPGKCVEITPEGIAALRRAMPLAIEVQRDMFGEPGRPGGSLLKALLQSLGRS